MSVSAATASLRARCRSSRLSAREMAAGGMARSVTLGPKQARVCWAQRAADGDDSRQPHVAVDASLAYRQLIRPKPGKPKHRPRQPSQQLPIARRIRIEKSSQTTIAQSAHGKHRESVRPSTDRTQPKTRKSQDQLPRLRDVKVTN